MDGKTLARLGAVVFVAVAITATAIEMSRKEEPTELGYVTAEHGSVRPLARRAVPLPGRRRSRAA